MSDCTTPPSVRDSENSDAIESAQRHSSRNQKHPCILCQQRKVKCDRNIPCAKCTKAGVHCVSTASLPVKKRKKRFSEAELLAKLRRYEDHLKAYGANLAAINDGIPPVKSGHKLPVDKKVKSDQRADLSSSKRSFQNMKNSLKERENKDFREIEETVQGSSEDDDMFESSITKFYDEQYGVEDDFFLPAGHMNCLADLHPPSVQIFQLWQIFLTSVNPLTKIFHAPTVQVQILNAATDLSNVDPSLEALMFSVYSMAIYTLESKECRDKFGQEKDVLLPRYQIGARTALHRAEFLRSSDLMVLQAFVLHLNSCVHFSTDPRSLFCLSGMALRIAQRMGLHSDGTEYGLSIFQIEMRRRTWWQLIILDFRISHISGVGPPVLNYHWTTKLPFNINDSDLFPDMKEPLADHSGLTEMVFVLQRCEILQQLQDSELTTGSSISRTQMIDDLEDKLHKQYITICDQSIPVQNISVLLTKLSISKSRLGHRPNSLFQKMATETQEDNEKSFRQALHMIELHNQMVRDPNLQHFQWYIWTHFPLRAHIYVLIALRYQYQTSEELSGRAWMQIAEAYSSSTGPFSQSASHTSLYYTVGSLTMKAWEAREKALRQVEAHALSVHVPRFISIVRNRLLERKQSLSRTLRENDRIDINTRLIDQAHDWSWQDGSTGTIFENPSTTGVQGQVLDQSFSSFITEAQTVDWGMFNNMVCQEYQPGTIRY